MKKYCVLEENKICVDCGECNRCDLDPNKICDNCCKCIEKTTEDDASDYAQIDVSDIVMEDAKEYLNAYFDDGNEGIADEEADESTDFPREYIDPKLLAEWEERLKETEEQGQSLSYKSIRGVRKRRQ